MRRTHAAAAAAATAAAAPAAADACGNCPWGPAKAQACPRRRRSLPTLLGGYRLTRYEAVYLIAPTMENIELLKADFTSKPLYAAAHVAFIDGASDTIIQAMAHPKLKASLRMVRELNLSFVPAEARVFSCDQPMGLHDVYSQHSRSNRQSVSPLPRSAPPLPHHHRATIERSQTVPI